MAYYLDVPVSRDLRRVRRVEGGPLYLVIPGVEGDDVMLSERVLATLAPHIPSFLADAAYYKDA